MTRGRTGRVFYGWAIVAATFVMLATSSGLGFYALTIYLRTLTEEKGFSVSSVSGATALFFVVSGITGVYVGKFIARRDPRPIIAAGAGLGALALVGVGRVEELWQVYACYAVFGAGFAGCSLVPSSTLVTRWFHRRRAVALSVSSTGLSVGGILLTPVVSALIDHLGFEAASVWLALIFIVGVVPITALLLKPDPATIGLRPDGDPPESAGGPAPSTQGTAYAPAVRSRLFLSITLAWALAQLSQVGAIAHLFSLVDERLDKGTAALAVSVLAFSSVAGRLIGGWLLTRVPLRPACMVWILFEVGGLTGLGLFDGRPALLVSASMFGLGVGNVLLLHPVVLAEVFGVRDYPRIYATSQLYSTVGVAIGPYLLGVLHDMADYRAAFLVAACISLSACGVVLAGGPLVMAPAEEEAVIRQRSPAGASQP